MKIGYARVSTKGQSLDRQLDALKEAGCEIIYQEQIKGTAEKTELQKMLEFARKGDIIVIVELTRISRSTKELIAIVDELNRKEVHLKSIKESWMDTSTAQGRLIFTIFSGLVQFEAELTRERTIDGLKSARARGRIGGRPSTNRKKIELALTMYDSQKYTVAEICRQTKLGKTTIYKYIRDREKEVKEGC